MKSGWKECKIGDFAEVKGGKRLPKDSRLTLTPNSHPYIRIRDLGKSKTLELTPDYEYVDDETQAKISRYTVDAGDVLISVVGTIGLIGIVGETLHRANQTENCDKIVNLRDVDRDYLYYYLVSPLGQSEIEKATVGAVQPKLPIKNILDIAVKLPPLETQHKIASILSSLDDKIELNDRINANLEEQAKAIFKSWFVNAKNPLRRECRADEAFNISIGKTPPRKEWQWFSNDPKDYIWASISDMGSCGTYIANSSEHLTKEAVQKHNINVIPDNTVLLSFKLTVGRVAITDGEMTTNEAIAHFKSDNAKIVEYLYCYLKNFSYQTMGSTSSIANAINSKFIKAMPFVVPTDDELTKFNNATAPLFERIKANQRENLRLSSLRDALLPRLLSGELDVSNLTI